MDDGLGAARCDGGKNSPEHISSNHVFVGDIEREKKKRSSCHTHRGAEPLINLLLIITREEFFF